MYGSTGLRSPGLQIFCPLNPKILLLLYDEKYYIFKEEFDNKININLESDVDSINSLQFFGSDNIFFSDKIDGKYIETLYSSVKESVRETSTEWEEFVASTGRREWMIHYDKDIDYQLTLSSFMFFKTDVGAVDLDRPDRNPRLTRECEEDFHRILGGNKIAVRNEIVFKGPSYD